MLLTWWSRLVHKIKILVSYCTTRDASINPVQIRFLGLQHWLLSETLEVGLKTPTPNRLTVASSPVESHRCRFASRQPSNRPASFSLGELSCFCWISSSMYRPLPVFGRVTPTIAGRKTRTRISQPATSAEANLVFSSCQNSDWCMCTRKNTSRRKE